jgi:hypothetical protein
MKTLIQRINESTLLDIKKYIKDEMQSDYTYALDLLKSINSATNVIVGVNNYIDGNNKTPLKNDGYYLAMLFESSGLSAEANIDVIKNIIEKNNQLANNELNTFLHRVLDFTQIADKQSKKMFVINSKQNDENDKNYIHNFLENTAAGNNIFTAYCQGFENLAKYIYYITTYKKPIHNSTNKIGNGELLIQLLFGSPIKNNGDVNVKLNDDNVINIEIKSGTGGLGSSTQSGSDISDKFLNTVKGILGKTNDDLNKEVKDKILTDETFKSRIKKIRGSIESDSVSIMHQHEDVYLNAIIKLAEDSTKREQIFDCFVSVILSRYTSNENDYTDVCNKLAKSFYRTDFINGNLKKTEIKYFVGLLHIIGYNIKKKFNYLCVTNDTGNFYTINCDKIEYIINTFNRFDNISSKIDFQRSSDTSMNKTIDIKLK